MTFPDYEEMMRYQSETSEAKATNVGDLVADLRAAGVRNRVVMVHSSYRALRPVERGPQGVVDAILEAVGHGIALFPTYNFEAFTELGYWDKRGTPSKMGVISETARLDPRLRRTPHPILSYATRPHVLVTGNPPNAHGPGSIFDKVIRANGLLVSFSGDGFRKEDVGFTASIHAICMAGAPYRITKLFRGIYIDDAGGISVPEVREYAACVCRPGYRTAVTAAHEVAEAEGVIQRFKLGRTSMLVADATSFHEWAMVAAIERPELFRVEL